MLLYQGIATTVIIWSVICGGVSASKLVEYNLTIGYFVASPDGHAVNVLGINTQVPSPTIRVTKGDTLVVNVINQDPAHSHSLHWHGLSQKGSPEMDGVVGVTQCGLPPFESMTYQFVVHDDPGTYWYHAHSGLNKIGARAIAGMLIVEAPQGEDVHEERYSGEKELFLQDWSHEAPMDHYWKSMGGLHPPVAQSSNAHNVALYPWTAGLLNGVGTGSGRHTVVQVNSPFSSFGEANGARLRIVNGGENFAFKVSVDRHRLLIISTDGTDTEPKIVDSVIVHLGERYDAIPIPGHKSLEDTPRAQDDGNFWIRAETLEQDKNAQVPMGHEVLAILRYAGAPDLLPESQPYDPAKEVILNCFDAGQEPSLHRSSKCLPVTALRVHSSLLYRYDRLVYEEPTETHEIAFEHSRGSRHYGHFTRQRSVDLESSIRTAHLIHIHGYKFVVVATHEADVFSRCSIVDCPHEQDWFSWPLDKHVVDETIEDGYVVKDTVVLPAGGYLVVRLVADNPGDWLAHCHTDFHLADGMGVLLREKGPDGEDAIISSPLGFPQCEGSAYEAFDLGAAAAQEPACECLPDPETVLHAAPEAGWRCSKEHLCRHEAIVADGDEMASNVASEQSRGGRVRGVPEERSWNRTVWTIVISVVITAVLSLSMMLWKPSDELDEQSSKAVKLLKLVLHDEWLKRMNIIALCQVLGLALVGGIIYFNAGFDTGERVFREKIAFVFWMCAYWSVSTIYSSIVTYYSDSWTTRNGSSMLYRKKVSKTETRRASDVKGEKSNEIQWWWWSQWIHCCRCRPTKGRDQPEQVRDCDASVRSNVRLELDSNSSMHFMNERVPRQPSRDNLTRVRSARTLQIQALGAPAPVHRSVSLSSLSDAAGDPHTKTDEVVFHCSIWAYHAARWMIGLLLSFPFPLLFATVTDAFTQLAPTLGAVFGAGFVLLLTQQAFDALGRLMAEVAGRKSISRAVCFGTIVSQLLVICGGFYRTVPSFISAVGPIRYSFGAICKLFFSAQDSFWCTPERAMAWRGYTWCSLELSGAVADLKFRGISIIDSYKAPNMWIDVGCLAVLITVLRLACFGMAQGKAYRKHRKLQVGKKNQGSLKAAAEKEDCEVADPFGEKGEHQTSSNWKKPSSQQGRQARSSWGTLSRSASTGALTDTEMMTSSSVHSLRSIPSMASIPENPVFDVDVSVGSFCSDSSSDAGGSVISDSDEEAIGLDLDASEDLGLSIFDA